MQALWADFVSLTLLLFLQTMTLSVLKPAMGTLKCVLLWTFPGAILQKSNVFCISELCFVEMKPSTKGAMWSKIIPLYAIGEWIKK